MSQFWRLDGPVQTLILAAEAEEAAAGHLLGGAPARIRRLRRARRRPCDGHHRRYARRQSGAVHLPRSQPDPFPVNRVSFAAMHRDAFCAQIFAFNKS